MSNNKHYTPIEGLIGDCGENQATIAVAVVLEPSPDYPSCVRIIVGHARRSECSDNGGGFSGDPAAIRRLARTLNQAADDVDAALGVTPDPAKLICAAWTDAEGTGPDVVSLALKDFPAKEIEHAFSSPEMHRSIHIIVQAVPDEGYCSSSAMAMLDGGLALRPDAAAELHRQLGAWLAKHGAKE